MWERAACSAAAVLELPPPATNSRSAAALAQRGPAHRSGCEVAWKTVPMRSPAMILTMFEGSSALQMTMRQPAAVAMRAAVSLVAMPPVPHCVPCVLVSTCV